MANEVLVKPGTPITWKPTGGTYALTLSSLATMAGRIGAQGNLGASFGRFARWRFQTKFAVAPVEGTQIEIYLATSDNTLRDGALGAADAALAVDEQRFQCQFLGVLYCRAVTTDQQTSGVVDLTSRYVTPVIFNATGQALSGTAGDHQFVLEPYIDEVQ